MDTAFAMVGQYKGYGIGAFLAYFMCCLPTFCSTPVVDVNVAYKCGIGDGVMSCSDGVVRTGGGDTGGCRCCLGHVALPSFFSANQICPNAKSEFRRTGHVKMVTTGDGSVECIQHWSCHVGWFPCERHTCACSVSGLFGRRACSAAIIPSHFIVVQCAWLISVMSAVVWRRVALVRYDTIFNYWQFFLILVRHIEGCDHSDSIWHLVSSAFGTVSFVWLVLGAYCYYAWCVAESLSLFVPWFVLTALASQVRDLNGASTLLDSVFRAMYFVELHSPFVWHLVRFVVARNSTKSDIELNPGPVVSLVPVNTPLQNFDVRCVLTAAGTPLNRMDSVILKHITAEACATYYRSVVPNTDAMTMKQCTAAFREEYLSLRDNYVLSVMRQYELEPHILRALTRVPMHKYLRDRIPDADTQELVLYDTAAAIDQLSALSTADNWDDDDDDESDTRAQMARRIVCPVCLFRVDPVGHEARCRIQFPVPQTENVGDDMLAYFANARYILDIRQLMLANHLDRSEAASKETYYRSQEFLAEFMRAQQRRTSNHEQYGQSDWAPEKLVSHFYTHYYRDVRDTVTEYIAKQQVNTGPSEYNGWSRLRAHGVASPTHIKPDE